MPSPQYVVEPIGWVESVLVDVDATPKQGTEGAPDAWIAIDPAFEHAIADLAIGDEIIVLTWLDRARRDVLRVHPRDDPAAPLTGVFSTRSADRPNPIGLHPVRIIEIVDLRVHVADLEAIDRTPVIDIKPVIQVSNQPNVRTVPWGAFAAAEPELARFGAARLAEPPAYLATVRAGGAPRVHPVTPIVTEDGCFVFMEPTSPKGRDVRERRWYALHNRVPDTDGSGGEFALHGHAFAVASPDTRAAAARAASYHPSDEYVLFELQIAEARARSYGDVRLPRRARWSP
jgi:tRNA-Thr(GGU) m(6)t(6)A37 methyltransferase TsaA